MDACHYSISTRDAQTLVYEDHEYQRKLAVGKTYSDESIPWRCSKTRVEAIKCKGSLRQLANGQIKVISDHNENCPPIAREDELNALMKFKCKKRSKQETTSLPQIYREERAKMIKSSGNIEAVAESITVIF